MHLSEVTCRKLVLPLGVIMNHHWSLSLNTVACCKDSSVLNICEFSSWLHSSLKDLDHLLRKASFCIILVIILSISYVLITSESLTFSVSTSQTLILGSFPLLNLIPASTLFLPTPFLPSTPALFFSHPYQITVPKSCSEL